MRKILTISLISLIAALLFSAPANARHLGPIVFGEERFEGVAFCTSLEHALLIAIQEESTKAGESPQEFFDKTLQLAEAGDCASMRIAYTPVETVHQWNGGVFFGESEIQVSLLKAQLGDMTLYIFTSDAAPPPANKPKL